jgi:hypothetical protein
MTWPVQYQGSPCFATDEAGAASRTLYETVAIDLLDSLTGRVYGTDDVTIKPERMGHTSDGRRLPSTFDRIPLRSWIPCRLDGQWRSIRCADYGLFVDEHEDETAVVLPGVSTTEGLVVKIDGADFAAWDLDGSVLTRTDGQPWPDAFDVTYRRGTPVPVGGQLSAGILACEFFKAASGDNTCALPQRVQTITRQGVTVGILDTFEDLKDGRTGIYFVDTWVASVTGKSVTKSARSGVMSPDYGRTRR